MKCWFCDGNGGETEVILDDGTGPWYPCGACDETGELNIFKWLYFKFLDKIWWPHLAKKHRRMK